MVVWMPEWFQVMTSDLSYPAGTPYGNQEAYWWGLAVGILSMTTASSGYQMWQAKKAQLYERSV
jgi:hypothetical protein